MSPTFTTLPAAGLAALRTATSGVATTVSACAVFGATYGGVVSFAAAITVSSGIGPGFVGATT
ncbi:MAG: hypothetical protein BWY91_03083 [bacterium ADurb.BinA028]|nr:MAG: hypothetical protein BWY91_03083 [bacterium ADurb.BinA028]